DGGETHVPETAFIASGAGRAILYGIVRRLGTLPSGVSVAPHRRQGRAEGRRTLGTRFARRAAEAPMHINGLKWNRALKVGLEPVGVGTWALVETLEDRRLLSANPAAHGLNPAVDGTYAGVLSAPATH